MKLRLKAEVRLSARHFDPVFTPVFPALIETAPPMDGGAILINSADDGEHGEVSLHSHGRALDVNTKLIRAANPDDRVLNARRWQRKLQRRLGPQWDVLFETEGDPHLHVEYDPKGSYVCDHCQRGWVVRG